MYDEELGMEDKPIQSNQVKPLIALGGRKVDGPRYGPWEVVGFERSIWVYNVGLVAAQTYGLWGCMGYI